MGYVSLGWNNVDAWHARGILYFYSLWLECVYSELVITFSVVVYILHGNLFVYQDVATMCTHFKPIGCLEVIIINQLW